MYVTAQISFQWHACCATCARARARLADQEIKIKRDAIETHVCERAHTHIKRVYNITTGKRGKEHAGIVLPGRSRVTRTVKVFRLSSIVS